MDVTQTKRILSLSFSRAYLSLLSSPYIIIYECCLKAPVVLWPAIRFSETNLVPFAWRRDVGAISFLPEVIFLTMFLSLDPPHKAMSIFILPQLSNKDGCALRREHPPAREPCRSQSLIITNERLIGSRNASASRVLFVWECSTFLIVFARGIVAVRDEKCRLGQQHKVLMFASSGWFPRKWELNDYWLVNGKRIRDKGSFTNILNIYKLKNIYIYQTSLKK